MMPLVAALSPDRQREAARLYRSGLSAKQTADRLNVGLDAVYYYLRKLRVPRRSVRESNRIRFETSEPSYCVKTNLSPAEHKLMLAAVMLYWAEGYKAGDHGVDFANSDPDMVILFTKFLRQICNVDEKRLRCYLYAYSGQDTKALQQYWANALDIPLAQFTKPYVKRAIEPGPRGPRMLYGLVHVRYCDKKLVRQILTWIDEYKLDLTRRW